ncbi:MAG: hypothetical protein B7Z23_01160 [Pseudomonadales bacterium 32-61-5]|uniref:hypothetical protein n=1 Tax=Stutzerimonas stutzeri TaxID=316 RepID=UPI000BD5FE98|nr:hypothetical protein [Stutzerimonas stutzeri]MBF6622034.1 hypothetical protein [Stutzerimonas stutzeri]MCQ4242463.1 hypothetical protein [Stutzerimonas stutzeri]OYW96264.1 MAG: hypothetical protein B7Z23_01160 [Pseudomonadales bacterium 32-61-5]
MALKHAQSGEAISLLRADPFPELRSQALVSTPSLEVMRLVLKAGHVVPSHAVAGPITIHCLQGVIEVQVESRWQTLQDNELMYLAESVEHALQIIADAVILVTIQRLPRNT